MQPPGDRALLAVVMQAYVDGRVVSRAVVLATSVTADGGR